MKRFKNIILGILAAGMLTVAAPVGGISAYASSAKISFSDPSATVGQEFSVNVKISSQDGNLGASDVVLSYDPSVIEFVSGNNASGGRCRPPGWNDGFQFDEGIFLYAEIQGSAGGKYVDLCGKL